MRVRPLTPARACCLGCLRPLRRPPFALLYAPTPSRAEAVICAEL